MTGRLVIAIDGPSASGKGTIAQAVARELGYHYLDSGALYRLVALAAIKEATSLGVDIAPHLTVVKVTEPAKRVAGVKVESAAELVSKLKNEAGVI